MIKTLDMGVNCFAGGPCQDGEGAAGVGLCRSRERVSRRGFHARPPTLQPIGHANLSPSRDFN